MSKKKPSWMEKDELENDPDFKEFKEEAEM